MASAPPVPHLLRSLPAPSIARASLERLFVMATTSQSQSQPQSQSQSQSQSLSQSQSTPLRSRSNSPAPAPAAASKGSTGTATAALPAPPAALTPVSLLLEDIDGDGALELVCATTAAASSSASGGAATGTNKGSTDGSVTGNASAGRGGLAVFRGLLAAENTSALALMEATAQEQQQHSEREDEQTSAASASTVFGSQNMRSTAASALLSPSIPSHLDGRSTYLTEVDSGNGRRRGGSRAGAVGNLGGDGSAENADVSKACKRADTLDDETRSALAVRHLRLLASHVALDLGPLTCIATCPNLLPTPSVRKHGRHSLFTRDTGSPEALSESEVEADKPSRRSLSDLRPSAGISEQQDPRLRGVFGSAADLLAVAAAESSERDALRSKNRADARSDAADGDRDLPVLSAFNTTSTPTTTPIKARVVRRRTSSASLSSPTDSPTKVTFVEDFVADRSRNLSLSDNSLGDDGGRPALLALTSDGVLHVFDGTDFAAVPVSMDKSSSQEPKIVKPVFSLPCVLNGSSILATDVDGDGKCEIIIGTSDGRICVYSLSRCSPPGRLEDLDRGQGELQAQASRSMQLSHATPRADSKDAAMDISSLDRDSDSRSARTSEVGDMLSDSTVVGSMMRSASATLLTTIERLSAKTPKRSSSNEEAQKQHSVSDFRSALAEFTVIEADDAQLARVQSRNGEEQRSDRLTLVLRRHFQVPTEVTALSFSKSVPPPRSPSNFAQDTSGSESMLLIGQRAGHVHIRIREFLRSRDALSAFPDGFVLRPSETGKGLYWFVSLSNDVRERVLSAPGSPVRGRGSNILPDVVLSEPLHDPSWREALRALPMLQSMMARDGNDPDVRSFMSSVDTAPVFAACDANGVLCVRPDLTQSPTIQEHLAWQLQLHPADAYVHNWIYVGEADFSTAGERLVCCADDGIVFVVDSARNAIRVDLLSRPDSTTRWPAAHERIAKFTAGSLPIRRLSQATNIASEQGHALLPNVLDTPIFACLTRGGELIVAYDLDVGEVASYTMVSLMRGNLTEFNELRHTAREFGRDDWSRQEQTSMFSSCLQVLTFDAGAIAVYEQSLAVQKDKLAAVMSKTMDRVRKKQARLLEEQQAAEREEALFQEGIISEIGSQNDTDAGVGMTRHRALS